MHNPVRPRDQSRNGKSRIREGRVEQYGRCEDVALDPTAQVQAVGTGQVIVEDDDIRVSPMKQRQHLLAVVSDPHKAHTR